MSNVSIPSLLDAVESTSAALAVAGRLSDKIVRTTWSDPTFTSNVDGGAATIVTRVSGHAGSRRIEAVDVQFNAGLHGVAVERVNRLLKGLGVPKVETYWRTKSVVVRAHGKMFSLPVTAGVTRSANGWQFVATGTLVTPRTVKSTKRAAKPVTPREAIVQAAQAIEAKVEEIVPTVVVKERKPKLSSTDTVKVDASAPSMPDPLDIFTFPVVSELTTVLMTPENQRAVEALYTLHEDGDRQVVAAFGPTGSGKTSLVYHLAATHGLGVFQFDAAGANTFVDWVGGTAVSERNGASVTEWQPSALIEALRADGPYAGHLRIILIDEANRVESPSAVNVCMALTHGVGGIYIPDARRTIKIDPKALIFYTGNIGSAYNATVPLDAAMLDRIGGVLQVDYVDAAQERKLVLDRVPKINGTVLDKLIFAARQTRDIVDQQQAIPVGVSTRRLIQAAKLIANAGMVPMEATDIAWINSYSGEGGASSERGIARVAVEATLRGLTADGTQGSGSAFYGLKGASQ